MLISALNAGIEGFVQAASQGLPRGLRLNAVCPPMVKETARKMGWGEGGMPAAEVASYYVELVERGYNGKIVGPIHE